MDAIKSHCGKWYSTEITEAHAEEIERLSQSMNEDDMIRAYAYGICASVSTTYLQQFMQTVDSNNQVMAQLQSMVSANKDSAEQVSNHVYEFKHQSFDVQLNLSNKTTPVFDLKGSSQRQKITLHHINNEKVEIVEKADGGDFIDLFGEAIYNAMKSAAESEM